MRAFQILGHVGWRTLQACTAHVQCCSNHFLTSYLLQRSIKAFPHFILLYTDISERALKKTKVHFGSFLSQQPLPSLISQSLTTTNSVSPYLDAPLSVFGTVSAASKWSCRFRSCSKRSRTTHSVNFLKFSYHQVDLSYLCYFRRFLPSQKTLCDQIAYSFRFSTWTM